MNNEHANIVDVKRSWFILLKILELLLNNELAILTFKARKYFLIHGLELHSGISR